jgi:long-chain acyl-CoA synthetase
MNREVGNFGFSKGKIEGGGGSIPEVLARRSRESPSLCALGHKNSDGLWISLSWKDYWDQVTRLAGAMARHGLDPGDRVVVILPTSVEWELIEKAALCRGLVVVGLEPHMAWEDMVRVMEDVPPCAVFVADRAMALKCTPVKLGVCLERGNDLPTLFLDWTSLERDMNKGSPHQESFSVSGETPATLLLTSGTTGVPKGIVYTQGQLLLAAQSILAAMGPYHKEDRTLAWLPMASPFQRTMNLVALLAGVPLYFQSDPKQLMKTIQEVRPTLLIGVPRVYEKIYQGVLEKLSRLPLGAGRVMISLLSAGMVITPRSSKEKREMFWLRRFILSVWRKLFFPVAKVMGGRMRFMVTGSAACREDVLVFFHALGLPLLEAYGVSECAVPISMNRPDDYRIGTVGRPLVVNTLSLNGGEVEVGGAGVFHGYENEDKGKIAPSGNCLRTGDIGEMDAEGYLTLVGRKSDLFKTSTGRKVAPGTIEQKLVKALGSEQAMVVGQGRPFLVAIVCFSGPRTPEQRVALNKNLEKMNDGLADYERVRGCVVLGRLFSMELGELTRNLKLRREKIEKIHRDVLNDIYKVHQGGETVSVRHI